MSITGQVIFVGPLSEGVSKKGNPWKKQEYVIQTDEQYPKKVAFSILNDKIAQAQIQMGHTVEIKVNAQSREYQGKWYTELTAWRINNKGVVSAPHQGQPVYQQEAPQGYQQPQYQSNPPQGNNNMAF